MQQNGQQHTELHEKKLRKGVKIVGHCYATTEEIAFAEIALLGGHPDGQKCCAEIQQKAKMPNWGHAVRAREEEVRQHGKEKKVDCSIRCEFRKTRQGDTNLNHRQVTNHVHRWREKSHSNTENWSGQIFDRPEHSI